MGECIIYIYIDIYIYRDIYVYVYIHTHTYVHMYIHTHIYIDVYVYVYVYVIMIRYLDPVGNDANLVFRSLWPTHRAENEFRFMVPGLRV